jgi:hypothetical protein
MAETPEVTILLLGDAEIGKTTFLSYGPPLFTGPRFVTPPPGLVTSLPIYLLKPQLT